MLQTVFYRTHITEAAMQTFSVIEEFDIFEYVCFHLFYCIILPAINQLLLQA